MKKLIYLLLAGTLAFASCSKDDPAPIAVGGITLDKTQLTLNPTQSKTLTATVTPEDAADKTVTWSSSDTQVATVNDSGKVTAVAVGSATVTAKAGGMSATCAVTVAPVEVDNVTLDKTELTLNPTQSKTLTAIVTPEDATDKTVTWSSSNTKIATVDDSGKVTAAGRGSATITAKAGGMSAFCTVTVAWPMETVLIPRGTFVMGSPENEPNRRSNEPQHQVTLTKDFYMGKYEVTNAQFAKFLNDVGIGESREGEVTYKDKGETVTESRRFLRPSNETGNTDMGLHFEGGRWVPVAGCDNHPVIFVSWFGATAYAAWAGGSLPTEAQWEYACRGGQTESLPFGISNGRQLVGGMANFMATKPYDMADNGEFEAPDSPDFLGKTAKIGSYSYPNGYGLYDMHGNVTEWCSDWYDDFYGLGQDMNISTSVTDPEGPATGEQRIMRGGHWENAGQFCRTALRDRQAPNNNSAIRGFRVIFPAE
ncbi:SUMF1/EgtB/PvdO family nonheme iron enzyme [uncultured Alistipes sp.]|uniref:SUMF1/EgtB/PvdO family nonheme iron enzyme n=1 Tax=uncultured Alistipes sp. TaxID=538949 RepID=UPI0025E7636F|nr:SUMF1/EgtB/PvdO family nonheme iron enzyme [uncultured Alistipes sp.]